MPESPDLAPPRPAPSTLDRLDQLAATLAAAQPWAVRDAASALIGALIEALREQASTNHALTTALRDLQDRRLAHTTGRTH